MTQANRLDLFLQSLKEKLILTLLLLLFSGNLFATVEKEQYPGSFSCKQVDSLLQEAVKYKPYNIELYKFLSSQALTIAKGLPCRLQEATALMNIACGYLYDESYYLALTTYFESADLFLEIDNIDGTILSLAYVVDCYLQLDATDYAFQYLGKIEILLARTTNPVNYSVFYLSKSQCDYKANRLDEAEKNAYLSLYYSAKADSGFLILRCLKILGDIKLENKDLTKSIFFYLSAVKQCKRLKEEGELAVLYTRLGHVYQLQNQYDLVLKYNYLALKIRERVGTEELIASSLINIGGSFLRVHKYDSAEYYLKKGTLMANKINRTLLLEHAFLELSRFYTAINNSKLALKNYYKYSEHHSKLIDDQNNKEIRKLEESRKIRELQMRSELLRKENELQRIHYRTSMIQTILLEAAFLFACAIVLLIYYLRRETIKSRQDLLKLNVRLKTDIEERWRAEQKLRQSEELFRFLAENSVDVITHLDKDLKRKYISPSSRNVLGYEPGELVDRSPFSIIDPDDHAYVNMVMEEMKKTRKPGNLLYRAITKDGKKKWVEVTLNPLFDQETGELREFLSTLRDVDERIKSEEVIAQNARQKEILLREIHTRVKNNFAVLISLMDLQKESTRNADLSLSLTELQLRVRTMSLVHEQLYSDKNIRKVQLHNYLMTLVTIISNAYEKERITLETHFQECYSDLELALPIGLIVNELLTNAFKYAFPGKTTGTIKVSLETCDGEKGVGQNAEDLWLLKVCDNGIGLPEFYSSEPKSGMGSQIIRILVDQIEARLEVINRSGACFSLIFSNTDKVNRSS